MSANILEFYTFHLAFYICLQKAVLRAGVPARTEWKRVKKGKPLNFEPIFILASSSSSGQMNASRNLCNTHLLWVDCWPGPKMSKVPTKINPNTQNYFIRMFSIVKISALNITRWLHFPFFAKLATRCHQLHWLPNWPPGWQTTWKLFGQRGNFPDNLESFQTAWKASRWPKWFPKDWKISRLLKMFPDGLEMFGKGNRDQIESTLVPKPTKSKFETSTQENVGWVQGKLRVNQSQIRGAWGRIQEKPHFPNWLPHNAICRPLNLIYGHKCRRTSVTTSKREKHKALENSKNCKYFSKFIFTPLFRLDSVYSFIIAN